MEPPAFARKAVLRKGVKKMTDRDYMLRAIELAKGGLGWTSPNPLVGAVIVKDGRIIGEGYHERCGKLHAERNAIASLTESAEGATLYVTLEPCCHYGKTPPSTEAILEQKIARVVIGSRDPNPLVAGKGAAILRAAGVRVEEDFMREECDALNPVFFHYITKKTPYVVMKYAMTADGKIAARTGDSKWITGAGAAPPVYGDHGGNRHGPGRRSDVKRPDPRAEESGADHLRQWTQDPDGFTDREDGKGVQDHRSVCGGAFRGRL